VIVPRKDEEPVWAKAVLAVSSAIESTLKTTSALGRESLIDLMHSSKGDLIFWTIDCCGWETNLQTSNADLQKVFHAQLGVI
jgi:hypothetical protein